MDTWRPGSPSTRLEIVRGHGEIENRLHHVRDVTFDEDRSLIRKGSGPHVMASLRNLAINLFRLAGATNAWLRLRGPVGTRCESAFA